MSFPFPLPNLTPRLFSRISRPHSVATTGKYSNPTFSSAQVFANANAADFIAAAGSAESIPKLHGLPEVIVTGRANAGKSTLFNAVLGRKNLLHTSKKAGRTRQLNFFRVGSEPGKLVLVDAPGYGARGRPEWGKLFDTYLETRKELRRVYVLFNGKHPLNRFDIQMLTHLSSVLLTPAGIQRFTLQSIITKADCIPYDKVGEVIEVMRKQIWEAAPLCFPPIVTSAGMSPPFGIEEVRMNVADACGRLSEEKRQGEMKDGVGCGS